MVSLITRSSVLHRGINGLRGGIGLIPSAMLIVGICLAGVDAIVAGPAAEEAFERSIRPVLTEKCHGCHGGEKISGGLRIDSREALLKGGDSGPAIVPGDADNSLLIQAIRRHEDVSAMPPEESLEATHVDALAKWVIDGAVWPESETFGNDRHWAFEPVTDPPLPEGTHGLSVGEESPIDAFLQPSMADLALKPLGTADRRQLLRRVAYDLTGLPPTFEEVEEFRADARPDALSRHVDRLLASPTYGERWGKHWLDVVRYADTAGDNTDRPLPYAWKYRNWVIEAFNRDRPYDAFLRDQIAGDILAADSPPEEYADHIVATGFFSLARRFDHDADKFMHLTFEDAIDTTGKALLGLTLGCARCHSHKYDPVSNADYYALYGILASSTFSFSGCEAKPKPRDLVSLVPPARREAIDQEREQRLAQIDERIRRIGEQESACIERLKSATSDTSVRLLAGTVIDASTNSVMPDPVSIEPFQVEQGQMLLLTIFPRGNHGADSTLVRVTIESTDASQAKWDLGDDVIGDFTVANPHSSRDGHESVWCFLDARRGLSLLPEKIEKLSGQEGLNVWRSGDTPSAFVNATDKAIDVWTSLAARSVFVHPGPDGPVALGWISPTSAVVRVTATIADAHPGGDGVDWQFDLVTENVGPELARQASIVSEMQQAKQERETIQAKSSDDDWAFAVVEGTPANAHIQERGDPEKLGAEVPRRWLEMFGAEEVQSGSGRRDLAQWMTDPANPLTYRVMVNRIWQHHFGAGIVTTPNDFGTRGAAPSHPELLDWLTREFSRLDLSVKAMHRMIIESSAYQRSSIAADSESASGADIDPNDVTRWRFSRRRLTAEEIRDSLLLASGELDRSPGESHPFPHPDTWKYTQHQPFADVYETSRRSVYLVILRNRRHPFLGLFDGADPNASTPQRPVTTVPTQALYFMNDPFLHESAAGLARRTEGEAGDARLSKMFTTVLQRQPTESEREMLSQFRRDASQRAGSDAEGWAALARLILSSNEFLYVD